VAQSECKVLGELSYTEFSFAHASANLGPKASTCLAEPILGLRRPQFELRCFADFWDQKGKFNGPGGSS